jgi:hypothetical protein
VQRTITSMPSIISEWCPWTKERHKRLRHHAHCIAKATFVREAATKASVVRLPNFRALERGCQGDRLPRHHRIGLGHIELKAEAAADFGALLPPAADRPNFRSQEPVRLAAIAVFPGGSFGGLLGPVACIAIGARHFAPEVTPQADLK